MLLKCKMLCMYIQLVHAHYINIFSSCKKETQKRGNRKAIIIYYFTYWLVGGPSCWREDRMQRGVLTQLMMQNRICTKRKWFVVFVLLLIKELRIAQYITYPIINLNWSICTKCFSFLYNYLVVSIVKKVKTPES